jgi:hypothetical protein
LDGHIEVPIDIHGWVEITRQDEPARSQEHAWSAVINIGALVDVGDIVSHRVFGIGLKIPPAREVAAPLAASRGLPPFPSESVVRDVEQIRSLEEQLGYSECAGYTFATWREVSAAGLSESELRSSDWQVVFDILRRLSDDPRLGADKIRCVVWCSV